MLSDGDSPIIMAIFGLIDDLRDWCSSGLELIRTTYDVCLELITAPDKGFHGS